MQWLVKTQLDELVAAFSLLIFSANKQFCVICYLSYINTELEFQQEEVASNL